MLTFIYHHYYIIQVCSTILNRDSFYTNSCVVVFILGMGLIYEAAHYQAQSQDKTLYTSFREYVPATPKCPAK